MEVELLDYKIQKQMEIIDTLITELVINRKCQETIVDSIAHCREQMAKEIFSKNLYWQGKGNCNDQQRYLFLQLRNAEKKAERNLRQASQELARICSYYQMVKRNE